MKNTSSIDNHLTVNIRHWQGTDLPAVKSIGWITWQATYLGLVPRADLEAYHREHYSQAKLKQKFRNHIGFVADANGRTVGYSLAVVLKDLKRYQITSMYVLPEYQGHKIGAGLLQHQMETARERGYSRLWLGVIVQNTRSLEWYRRQGFVFTEKEIFNFGDTPVELKVGGIKL